MRAEHGNPVGVRHAFWVGGKPEVTKAQLPGGYRMPKKPMPAAERRQESEKRLIGPPPIISYNWPDTGPCAWARKRAHLGR